MIKKVKKEVSEEGHPQDESKGKPLAGEVKEGKRKSAKEKKPGRKLKKAAGKVREAEKALQKAQSRIQKVREKFEKAVEKEASKGNKSGK